MNKINILDVLDYGIVNAKTSKELSNILNYNSTRRVSKEIEVLRKRGEVILSCNTGNYRGYFKPETKAELERFRNSMYSRLKNIKLSVISTDKMLKDLEINHKDIDNLNELDLSSLDKLIDLNLDSIDLNLSF